RDVRQTLRASSVSRPPAARPTLFPYTTLFRSRSAACCAAGASNAATRGSIFPRSPSNAWINRDLLFPVAMICNPNRTPVQTWRRSEEHTSELQSPDHLVFRPQLDNKKHVTNAH